MRDAAGDRWRCMEHPELVMLRGGGFEVAGPGFYPLAEAVRRAVERAQARRDIPEADRQA